MALFTKHDEISFGVGDVVRVHQKVADPRKGGKPRIQIFEGTVIGIKNRGNGKSFTVRRIGSQKVGIEQIFPLSSPNVKKIEVVREGTKGTSQAKLYYIRDKSKKETEKIYGRARRRSQA